MSKSTFTRRSHASLNPTGAHLLELMDRKKTNLALSADVIHCDDLLKLADLIGPEICVLKTHVDILVDFNPFFIQELCRLSEKHDFMIFEDRKFADIGTTVQKQYRDGIYRISDWAHITNAHVIPGPGIIQGLKEVGLEKKRGLLLLAEMSSQENLATDSYTHQAVLWAEENADFVIGFICRRKLSSLSSMIHFTPGVHLHSGQDQLGQCYLTPTDVIEKNESDIIIVGRGIIQSKDPLRTAKKYRKAAWTAYRNRVQRADTQTT
ncbi:MAG: orotidine-5'-phosphate decarboxylase [Chlamydiia bacterium]|nr:orotidine-5'-phosphate decarboxylase [Chlamydiia bacterium]